VTGFDVRVLPPTGWAAAVADAWEERLTERPGLRMCLATGSTPTPVYEAMTARPVSWSDAAVVLLDEWGDIPRDEPGSCDATLRRELLDHVDLPAASFRAIDAWADDLDAECAGVDAWLDGGLDLAVLGVGTNGHLGMNEPGSPPDARTRRVALAEPTREGARRYFAGRIEPPTWGVTVGLRDLLAADEVWVLATGERKAGVVQASLHGPVATDVPASLVRRHPRLVWWLDEASAGT
jgi:glucosamine-6-phosphate deaminase